MSSFTIHSILAATDLSATSDEVLRSSAMLASRSGAELHVISAFAQPTSMLAGSEPSDGVVAEAERSLSSQLRRVLGDEEKSIVSRVVRFGPSGRTIVARAEEISADVIALGGHRGGNVAAHFLGTTADAVLRSASASCLVLRGSLERPVSRIGVAMDFSDVTGAALETALAWCEQLSRTREGAPPRVEVLHVTAGDGGAGSDPERSAHIQGSLDAAISRAGERTGVASNASVTRRVLESGNPAAAIVAWALHERADLIVMGTHGKRASERAAIGSVSSEVARRAPCAVLLVPPAG